MFRKIIISILMLMLSNVGYSAVSKKEKWVKLCKSATGEKKNTCDSLRRLAGVSPSIFSGNWRKAYDILNKETELHLDNNPDISPIAGFTNLTRLKIENSDLYDISPIAGLTNLTSLSLYGNQITDISPIAGFTNLSYLNLESNQISDISPLDELTNLETLHLDNNHISVLSPISGLTNLTVLSLGINQISEISSLAELEKLWFIDLNGNQITDISPIAGLKKITKLNLSENRISDVSPLSGLKNLTKLDISNNQISNFRGVSHVKNVVGREKGATAKALESMGTAAYKVAAFGCGVCRIAIWTGYAAVCIGEDLLKKDNPNSRRSGGISMPPGSLRFR